MHADVHMHTPVCLLHHPPCACCTARHLLPWPAAVCPCMVLVLQGMRPSIHQHAVLAACMHACLSTAPLLLLPRCTAQVLVQPSSQYKTFYGLPAVDSVRAWEPDAGAPAEQREQGQFFFTVAGDVPTVRVAHMGPFAAAAAAEGACCKAGTVRIASTKDTLPAPAA